MKINCNYVQPAKNLQCKNKNYDFRKWKFKKWKIHFCGVDQGSSCIKSQKQMISDVLMWTRLTQWDAIWLKSALI